MGHRFILTGRQLALQGISYLPDNLERVELSEMDDEIQQQWLDRWQKVVDTDPASAQQKTAAFKKFLQADNLPKQVKEELAREPLLLYLLAKMHQKEEIKLEDLETTSGIQAKIQIYEKALKSVLEEQRQGSQKEIVRLAPEELRQVLMEAGLCVVQSGGEYTKVKMIEQRLEKSKPKIATKIQIIREEKRDDVLKNALAAFYIKPAAKNEAGAVEFFHKSFCEFLCAKLMQQSLEKWTKWQQDDDEFYLDKKQLSDEVYDLLGYGGLSPEIVEYLFGLLIKSKNWQPALLFRRLEDFYLCWCKGKFIDEPPDTNSPQKKMRFLGEQKPEASKGENVLGLCQVDIYTGLNVIILLLELHRYGQQQTGNLKEAMTFYPCGKLNETGKLENSTRLLKLIGYSHCIFFNGFLSIAGRFLSGANLSGADLNRANLRGANLSGANLSGADLSGANLSGADLNRANLRGANLSGANFSRANFSGANLSDANLSGTNFIGVSFSGANLSDANLSGASFSRANFSGANLNRANLSGANFSGTNLSHANFIGANFSGANLNRANFSGADLSDADLSGADLSGADLSVVNNLTAKLVKYASFWQEAKFNTEFLEQLKKGS